MGMSAGVRSEDSYIYTVKSLFLLYICFWDRFPFAAGKPEFIQFFFSYKKGCLNFKYKCVDYN